MNSKKFKEISKDKECGLIYEIIMDKAIECCQNIKMLIK